MGDRITQQSLGTSQNVTPPPPEQETPPQGEEPHPRSAVGAGRSSIPDDAGRIKEAVTRALAEAALRLRRLFTPCNVAWEKSIREASGRNGAETRAGAGGKAELPLRCGVQARLARLSGSPGMLRLAAAELGLPLPAPAALAGVSAPGTRPGATLAPPAAAAPFPSGEEPPLPLPAPGCSSQPGRRRCWRTDRLGKGQLFPLTHQAETRAGMCHKRPAGAGVTQSHARGRRRAEHLPGTPVPAAGTCPCREALPLRCCLPSCWRAVSSPWIAASSPEGCE